MEKTNPMQGHEFFGRVNAVLEEKRLLPEHLEYAFPAGTERMESDEFVILGKLDYGSKGIYLDLEAEFYETGRKVQLGIYRTLEESDGAMREMGALYGSFIAEGRRYVRENPEEFERVDYVDIELF